MEIKEATSKINTFIEVWELEQADEEIQMIVYKQDIEAFKIIKEVLEKQTEIEPTWEGGVSFYDDDMKAYCPICDYYFKNESLYCPDCGQKILWK